jgi:5-methylcytosine-specific restriction endonuclease McrA
MRQQVYDRDKGRCYMCDRRLAPGWHIEHVIPLARGGTDTLDNVRASCPRCNRRKGLQPPIFRRSI